MTKQEKRGMADLRHFEREKRLQKLLADKARMKSRNTAPPPHSDEPTGLVTNVGPGICIISQHGQLRPVRCEISVAPGDQVTVRNEKVAAIAPRRTTLSRTDPAHPHRERVIAANIDLLVIVASIRDPPFRPGLVDRYLVAAQRGGLEAVLCLNKADLASPAEMTEAAGLFAIPTVRCSTLTGEGMEDLRTLLTGNLSVLAGHSGVGKSSLLNFLTASQLARTGIVSHETGKGRHTTSSSNLIDVGNGARVIDTPGIREFGLGRITLAELYRAFPGFSSNKCAYSDCTHRSEPGCPIRDSPPLRYAAWLRLAAEL